MNKILKSKLLNIFKKKNINSSKILFRNEYNKIWDEVTDKSKHCPVFYTNSFIQYQLEYNFFKNKKCYELSYILFYNGEPISILPLFIKKENSEYKIFYISNYLIAPLFKQSVNLTLTKKIIDLHFSIIYELSLSLNCKVVFDESNLTEEQITSFHFYLINKCSKITVNYNLYLKICSELTDTKRFIRKSYKNILNKINLKIYSFHQLKKNKLNIWVSFKKLHKQESGKITRSSKSWQVQYENIINNKAIFIYCLKNNKLIGGALFDISKDEAFYSVGVYSNEYKHEPISHFIQMMAINEFNNKKIKWYRVGSYISEAMDKSIEKKEHKISFFKSGFASHVFSNYKFYIK